MTSSGSAASRIPAIAAGLAAIVVGQLLIRDSRASEFDELVAHVAMWTSAAAATTHVFGRVPAIAADVGVGITFVAAFMLYEIGGLAFLVSSVFFVASAVSLLSGRRRVRRVLRRTAIALAFVNIGMSIVSLGGYFVVGLPAALVLFAWAYTLGRSGDAPARPV